MLSESRLIALHKGSEQTSISPPSESTGFLKSFNLLNLQGSQTPIQHSLASSCSVRWKSLLKSPVKSMGIILPTSVDSGLHLRIKIYSALKRATQDQSILFQGFFIPSQIPLFFFQTIVRFKKSWSQVHIQMNRFGDNYCHQCFYTIPMNVFWKLMGITLNWHNNVKVSWWLKRRKGTHKEKN